MAKQDPTEELIELHLEIQEFEKQFKDCLEISQILLKKNKEMAEGLKNSNNSTMLANISFERQ